MSNRYLRRSLHQQLWAENYARHLEGLRLGLTHERLEHMWPSTEKVEGGRGPVSPLGGQAIEKEPR
jgi:hypothetical protein